MFWSNLGQKKPLLCATDLKLNRDLNISKTLDFLILRATGVPCSPALLRHQQTPTVSFLQVSMDMPDCCLTVL